jgi:outer membrane protein OmpA-like peptidoglycan-associated protein
MKAGTIVFALALAGMVAGCLPAPPSPPRVVPPPEPPTVGHSMRVVQLAKPAPPPAPAPTVAAAPGPEPPARDYLIFFDFDKTDIRADSAGILEQVIEAIGALNAKGAGLIGHADRAGSNAYNQSLSERRADAVKDFLAGRGVPAGQISTQGRGETDPRVPTPDGVREEQNRRVEIRIE